MVQPSAKKPHANLVRVRDRLRVGVKALDGVGRRWCEPVGEEQPEEQDEHHAHHVAPRHELSVCQQPPSNGARRGRVVGLGGLQAGCRQAAGGLRASCGWAVGRVVVHRSRSRRTVLMSFRKVSRPQTSSHGITATRSTTNQPLAYRSATERQHGVRLVLVGRGGGGVGWGGAKGWVSRCESEFALGVG